MSRKYEGLIVLNTKGIEGSIDDLVSAVAKEMETEGAKLGEVRQLGRRKFAYNARRLESGHYVNYLFEAAPENIEKIESRLRLNTKVHLQHFSRLS